MFSKGIILAAGKGTRLRPMTNAVSKHLLNIHDKPMIFYSLNTLMQAHIREILIITNPKDLESYQNVLGNGEQLGIDIKYEIQEKPNGIAEAFIIGQEFLASSKCILMLGDNILLNNNLNLMEIIQNNKGASLFSYPVDNPKNFGILKINTKKEIISIDEKPKNPKTNLAIIGLYIFDNNVTNIAKSLRPPKRNELEITDINNFYIKNSNTKVYKIDGSAFWIDAGSVKNLNIARKFVSKRQNKLSYPGYLEVTAFKNGWIEKSMISSTIRKYKDSEYAFNLGKFLKQL